MANFEEETESRRNGEVKERGQKRSVAHQYRMRPANPSSDTGAGRLLHSRSSVCGVSHHEVVLRHHG